MALNIASNVPKMDSNFFNTGSLHVSEKAWTVLASSMSWRVPGRYILACHAFVVFDGVRVHHKQIPVSLGREYLV